MAGLFLGYILFKKAKKYVKERCKIDCQKYYFYKLKQVDWSNPKKAAYDITRYGLFLAQDKRRKEIFSQLRKRLDRYKYRQDYDDVDKETINYYNLYVQVCDESL